MKLERRKIKPINERHKLVYDRHKAGETYAAIGRDMKISTERVRVLAMKYERFLKAKK